MDTMTNLKGESGRDARRRIRAGTNLAPTSGMAPGYVQGNLAILPKELAADFLFHLQDALLATAGINQNSQSQREI